MKKLLALALLFSMILFAFNSCSQNTEEPYASESKDLHTESPETENPETEEPETKAPETETPETETPETKIPETEPDEDPKDPENDNINNPGNEIGFKMLRYTYSWDGGGIGSKNIKPGDVSYAVFGYLLRLKETGETVPKISDELEIDYRSDLPVESGTMWLECGDLGIFRINPERSEICKVQTHLGEGIALKMNEDLAKLLRQILYYYPNDCWSGRYEDGIITLDHVFSDKSVIKDVRIDDVIIRNMRNENNTIILTLVANETATKEIKIISSNGGDVFGISDSKNVQLVENKEVQVELSFGGLSENWNCFATMYIDNTRINFTIYNYND